MPLTKYEYTVPTIIIVPLEGRFYFYKLIGKPTAFLQLQEFSLHNLLFHFRRATFSSQLKDKVGKILAKAAALRINLNIDVDPIGF
jgi:hypothetical protein